MLLNKPRRLAARITAIPNKRLPVDFKAAVALLKRPYYRLDEAAYELVCRVAGDSDVLLFDGRQVTYGNADGGRALMPLSREV